MLRFADQRRQPALLDVLPQFLGGGEIAANNAKYCYQSGSLVMQKLPWEMASKSVVSGCVMRGQTRSVPLSATHEHRMRICACASDAAEAQHSCPRRNTPASL